MIYKRFSYIQQAVQEIVHREIEHELDGVNNRIEALEEYVQGKIQQIENKNKQFFNNFSQQRIGTIFYSSVTYHDDALLCDGSEVFGMDYEDLWHKIGNTFGEPSSGDKFKLPNLISLCIWGTPNSPGTKINAGLPNITGTVTSYDFIEQPVVTGCFYDAGTSSYNPPGDGSGTSHKLGFNASRSSSIYGKSSTVQPPALCLVPFIYFQ